MSNIEAYVLKEDVGAAMLFLDSYSFYSQRSIRSKESLEYANYYLEKLRDLVAKKREHDQLEIFKKHFIEMGVTQVEVYGQTFIVQHINVDLRGGE